MVSSGKGEWFHEGKHEVRAEEQSRRRGKGWKERETGRA